MKIKLGVIGMNKIWHDTYLPAIKRLKDKFEIAAICDKNKNNLFNSARKMKMHINNLYLDYQELLKRGDISDIILLYEEETFVIAKDILKARKNLITEDFFAGNLEEAKELINLKEEYSQKFVVFNNCRFNEQYEFIKEMIYYKRFGEVKQFIFHSNIIKENDYMLILKDLAVLRFLFGDITKIKISGQENSNYDLENIIALLEFDRQISGSYIFSFQGKELNNRKIGLRILFRDVEIYHSPNNRKIYLYDDSKVKVIRFAKKKRIQQSFMNYYDGKSNLTYEKELCDIQAIYSLLNKITEKTILLKKEYLAEIANL